MAKYSYLFLLNTIVFFSTYEVVTSAISSEINLIQVNFLRFLIGGSILLPFAFFSLRRQKMPDLKTVLSAVPVGVLNVCISMTFLQLGILYAGAAFAAVLFSCNPIFVAFFSHFLLRENMNKYKVLGLVLGIGGVTVTFLQGLFSGSVVMMGIIFAILAAITFGLYTVLGKRTCGYLGSTMMNSVSFVSGSLILLPILALTNQPTFNFNPTVIVPLAYLSICVTGFAYLTYFTALKDMPANVGSSVFFVKPVAASILAVIFLGEQITPFLVVGGSLVLVGMYFIVFYKKSREAEKEQPICTIE